MQAYAVSGKCDLTVTLGSSVLNSLAGFPIPAGRRKSATAQAVVYEHGSGKIHVNGVDYLIYFPITQDR